MPGAGWGKSKKAMDASHEGVAAYLPEELGNLNKKEKTI